MKKRDFLRELSKLGWFKVRDKGPHEIWGNGTYTMPIPRHVELHKFLALRLLREADDLNRKKLLQETDAPPPAPTSPKKVSNISPRRSIQNIAKARLSVLKALATVEGNFTKTAQSWWRNFAPNTPIIPKVTTIPNIPTKGVDPTALLDATQLNKTLQDANNNSSNEEPTPESITTSFEIDSDTQKLFKNFQFEQSGTGGSAANAGNNKSSPGASWKVTQLITNSTEDSKASATPEITPNTELPSTISQTPVSPPATSTDSSSSSYQTPNATPSKSNSYTVRPGDMLSTIAQKHNTTWKKLWELNKNKSYTDSSGKQKKFTSPNLIYPGLQLKLR